MLLWCYKDVSHAIKTNQNSMYNLGSLQRKSMKYQNHANQCIVVLKVLFSVLNLNSLSMLSILVRFCGNICFCRYWLKDSPSQNEMKIV